MHRSIVYCILLNDTAVSVSSLSSWHILTRWRVRVGDANTIARKEKRTPVVLFASCSPRCFPLLVHVRARKKLVERRRYFARTWPKCNFDPRSILHRKARPPYRYFSNSFRGSYVLRYEFVFRTRFSVHARLFIRKVFSKRASSREAIVCWVLVALLSTLAANN